MALTSKAPPICFSGPDLTSAAWVVVHAIARPATRRVAPIRTLMLCLLSLTQRIRARRLHYSQPSCPQHEAQYMQYALGRLVRITYSIFSSHKRRRFATGRRAPYKVTYQNDPSG